MSRRLYYYPESSPDPDGDRGGRRIALLRDVALYTPRFCRWVFMD